uniref:Uncharacterized protein n=1 Tax=Bactrocera latifrons TaxID=174628 RepID=A0A0K8W7R5_BACLA
MLYSFKLSVLLTALLLHTVTSKGGRTPTQSNKVQTLLIPQKEVNEPDYSVEDEGSVILEVPIAEGPRDLGALLALQTATTQRPHHDHHEHHYHHHHRRPARRPPKRRPCYDDDEDSDECDEYYYGRPSWQHTSHWYVASPQLPPVASPKPSHYGPQPNYYPQPSYPPQQYYPPQYYPPPYYPSPYYPPPFYYNFPPWYFFNRTITG